MNVNTRCQISSIVQVDEAKQELKDVVEFLRNPERFKRLGGKMPTGEKPRSTQFFFLLFSFSN